MIVEVVEVVVKMPQMISTIASRFLEFELLQVAEG